ncbi:MAG: putative molybdenum carrier protein [Immundisolibacteraceae bacterium]|nr:putative molybdenum carrier protein [Immundisolibacteraceae bacterium]
MTSPLSITKIISGGQTGVDRGALDAALALEFNCGGQCPKGRLAEDGPIDPKYPLDESASSRYQDRTEQNVIDSDATLIISGGRIEGGTRLTMELALKHDKPCLITDLRRPTPIKQLASELAALKIEILNIAGPRESKQPGVARQAQILITDLLQS